MIGRGDKEFRVEGIQVCNFSTEKLVLLGTVCIKQLMNLIFLTCNAEIIKLEQPELKWCLFWTKNQKVVFKFCPLGAYFKFYN